MRTIYLDVFSGISGDMFLGAMLDLGVSKEKLTSELAKLGLEEYHLHVSRKQKSNIAGVKFDVELTAHSHDHEHSHEHGHSHDHEHGRNFSQIKELIQQSGLSEWVQLNAIETFARVARAEGKVHGMPPDEVHFHEVGAVDSIVDIVGACIALEQLGKPHLSASNVVEGTGWVHCAHGRFPVPTMATLAILGERGIPLTQCEEPHELVTPTGAAILAQFVDSFGPMNQLVATQIGYGLGTRDNHTRPNVLRAVMGDSPDHKITVDWDTDTIGVIECNLDDLSPEILGHTMGLALEAGALDVFHAPIQMKKQRPGVLFTILCRVEEITQFSKLVLLETSAFGVRTYETKRFKLKRTESSVKTPYGSIAVKIGYLDGKVIRITPEYDSCRELARKHDVPLQEIMGAVATAQQSLRSESHESGSNSDST